MHLYKVHCITWCCMMANVLMACGHPHILTWVGTHDDFRDGGLPISGPLWAPHHPMVWGGIALHCMRCMHIPVYRPPYSRGHIRVYAYTYTLDVHAYDPYALAYPLVASGDETQIGQFRVQTLKSGDPKMSCGVTTCDHIMRYGSWDVPHHVCACTMHLHVYTLKGRIQCIYIHH